MARRVEDEYIRRLESPVKGDATDKGGRPQVDVEHGVASSHREPVRAGVAVGGKQGTVARCGRAVSERRGTLGVEGLVVVLLRIDPNEERLLADKGKGALCRGLLSRATAGGGTPVTA